jgi:hypothetical protein
MPKLSIGIPVFNGQELLPELLEIALRRSVINMSAPMLAFIMSAISGTSELSQISIGCSSFRRRPCSNGLPTTTSTMETYLDACVRLLEENPDVVLAHTGTAFINEKGELLPFEQETGSFVDPTSQRRYWADVPGIGDTPVAINRFWHVLTRARWGTHMFGVVRRDILKQTSLLPNFAGSDRAMLAELALLGRFRCANERLFFKRFHADVSWALSQKELKVFLSTDGKPYSRRLRQMKAFFGAPRGKPIGLLSKSVRHAGGCTQCRRGRPTRAPRRPAQGSSWLWMAGDGCPTAAPEDTRLGWRWRPARGLRQVTFCFSARSNALLRRSPPCGRVRRRQGR